MKIEFETFNAQELCSRKLWQLISSDEARGQLEEAALREAIEELASRRHYLAELEDMGQLAEPF